MTAPTTGTKRPDETAMIDANLELSRRFFAAAFDDPSLLDDLPPDATVVLIPFDDPDLARANLAAAEREERLGKQIVLRIVGAPKSARPEWDANQTEQLAFKMLRPRWPEGIENQPVVLHYYQDTDALIARFADDDRIGLAIPWRGPALLLVELGTQDVLGYLLPCFIESVVADAPHLREWLRQAKIHAQTPDDLRQLLDDATSAPRPEPTIEDLRKDIGDVKLAG